MMTLAKEIGIDVPEFGLVPIGSIGNLPPQFAEGNTNAYFIRRFDRGPDGERIHVEDFNQIYGQYPEKKYEEHGYTGMAKDIWALLGEKGLTEFIRRIVFNAAIGNADMHLKNWSLLYRDGRTPDACTRLRLCFHHAISAGPRLRPAASTNKRRISLG